MNVQKLNEQLDQAEAEVIDARRRYNEATSRKERREADEDLQFWMGKAAALTVSLEAWTN